MPKELNPKRLTTLEDDTDIVLLGELAEKIEKELQKPSKVSKKNKIVTEKAPHVA